jgi:predicted AlkP superfamily phosphohydrolase/phosphomutase
MNTKSYGHQTDYIYITRLTIFITFFKDIFKIYGRFFIKHWLTDVRYLTLSEQYISCIRDDKKYIMTKKSSKSR